MGRPRKPTKLLELTGSIRKDPKRLAERRNEPKPTGPLGDPPAAMSEAEMACWLEIASLAPAGVLTVSDRWAVEMACGIMADLRQNGRGGKRGVSNGELNVLSNLIARFGFTPADRSKVTVAKDDEEANPFKKIG